MMQERELLFYADVGQEKQWGIPELDSLSVKDREAHCDVSLSLSCDLKEATQFPPSF